MPFIVDTTVLIDAARHKEPAYSWLRAALRRPGEVAVSAVNVAEFFAGLRPDERPRWEAFVDELACWDVTREIAKLAGTYQYDSARRGQTIHIADALVAATAFTVGADVVTDNIKDFPMADVTTIRLVP